MRKNGRRQVMTVAEMTEAAPPVPALEALRRNLLYAMLKGVTEDDMTAVVARQVEKAMEGDPKAARLLIDMVRAGGGSEAPSVQHTTVYGHHGNVTIFLSDIRHKLAVVLAKEGPRPAEVLAERARLLLPDALQALNHDWFEKEQDVWNVTDKGRREALELKG